MGLFVLDSCQLSPVLATHPFQYPYLRQRIFRPSLTESWLTFIHLLQEPHYRTRGRIRDGKCLITGMQTQTYSRLKVAHTFPRAHDVEVSHLYLSHTY